MLILSRKEGEWIEVTHVGSGDTFWMCVSRKSRKQPLPAMNVVLHDDARHFHFERPGRRQEQSGA